MRRGKYKDEMIRQVIDATLLGYKLQSARFNTWSAIIVRQDIYAKYMFKWWHPNTRDNYPQTKDIDSEEAIRLVNEHWKNKFSEYRKGPL